MPPRPRNRTGSKLPPYVYRERDRWFWRPYRDGMLLPRQTLRSAGKPIPGGATLAQIWSAYEAATREPQISLSLEALYQSVDELGLANVEA